MVVVLGLEKRMNERKGWRMLVVWHISVVWLECEGGSSHIWSVFVEGRWR